MGDPVGESVFFPSPSTDIRIVYGNETTRIPQIENEGESSRDL